MALKSLLLCTLFALTLSCAWRKDATKDAPPPVAREFRAAWVATVANIDWPSKPGLTTAQQKAQLIAILDKAVQLRLNALVFQVRPACDALYASPYEPWSEWLTGRMGQAPDPFYDPLAFAVEEAHRRGLELHAWFNPYRAHHPLQKSPLAENHISKTHPEIVRRYGSHLWLDPGEKATQEHSLNVLLDVVKRYDIDGAHIDDYFYPYHEKDTAGKEIPFPDEPSWQRYVKAGGALGREDWRRENVNTFVQRLYRAVKAQKPWVKVGISPFGIWRPGNPPSIKGFDAYEELYADARKWLRNGWCDYWSPQLYWKIAAPAQSYPALLQWWVEQNAQGRHVWPGSYTGRVGEGWPAEEIVNQIRATRSQPGATGNVHFSMKVLMQNGGGLAERLAKGVYAAPALVPASPWLDRRPPGRPKLAVQRAVESGRIKLAWKAAGAEKVWRWVVQARVGGAWTTEILPGETTAHVLPAADAVAVSAVDRIGNQSPPTVAAVKGAQ